MNHRVELHRQAVADLREAHDWYERREPGLGARFIARAEQTFDRIASAPYRFPTWLRNTRRGRIPGFPYTAIFVERAGGITIICVFHHSRDPQVAVRLLERFEEE